MTANSAIWDKLSARIYGLLALVTALAYAPNEQIVIRDTIVMDWFTAKVIFVAVLVDRLARGLPKRIRDFDTESVLASKRFNEQIKFTANLFNGVAVAILAAFLFKERWGFDPPTIVGTMPIIVLSLWIHFHARDILGELKSDI